VPNPSRGAVRLRASGALGAGARVSVISPAGRVVRSWRSAPGVETIEWDGRDASGVRAPAGVYVIEVATTLERASRKALLLP
jgi:flagellar hook assembly protein FlgD